MSTQTERLFATDVRIREAAIAVMVAKQDLSYAKQQVQEAMQELEHRQDHLAELTAAWAGKGKR